MVAYVLVAAAWILVSDQVVRWIFADPDMLTAAATLKGWVFVAVTTGLLVILLARYEREREHQRAALAERERTFRLLAERARDVIFRFRVAPDLGVEYVSPSVETALGYRPEMLMGNPAFVASLIHPDDPPLVSADAVSIPDGALVVVRLHAADGRWVPFEVNIGRPPASESGTVTVEGVARDISERRQAEDELLRLNRVRRMMAEVNRSLVRATTEPELLDAICRAVVDEGTFRFAWVGLIDPETGRSVPRAHAGHEAGYLTADAGNTGPRKRAPGPVARSLAEGRPITVSDIASDPMMAPRREDALARGYASMASLPLIGRAGLLGTMAIYASEPNAFELRDVELLRELAADLAFGIETLRDRGAHEAGAALRRRLATAVEQSHESIVITDADARIQYVNPNFERLTGYASQDVLGKNPRILQSGVQSEAFYASMWESLRAGRPWVGDLVNRLRNGDLYIEEAVISPVHDEAGMITGYVAVQRDVTDERATEERAQTQARERALIADALAALGPEDTAEQTAAAICRQLARMPEVSVSWLLAFDPSGGARVLAGIERDGHVWAARLPREEQAAHLLESAALGPWVEPWPTDGGPLARDPDADLPPIRHAAYAPIRVEGEVVGLLGIGTADGSGGSSLTERLPALAEFAGIAGVVLGPSLSHRTAGAASLARIRSVLDTGAFLPVFQPIVDIVRGEVLGVEALTRFADGTPPDLAFLEAARAGLGLELELATATAALAAARDLPPGSSSA